MRYQFSILSLLISSLTVAQSIPFKDADSGAAAVGHFYTLRALSTEMLKECSKHVPDMKEEMSNNLQAWLKADSAVLKKTDQYFNREAPHDPFARGLSKQVAEEVEARINWLAGTSNGEEKVQGFCKAHFDGLVNGGYRNLTPNAYLYINQLPWLAK